LTTEQLQSLARELRSERARLQRSISAARGREDGASAPDGLRRTPATLEEGFAQSLESRTLARHEALTEALRHLEAGTYGVCSRCDRPIPYGRLLLMPEATHCVDC
jgi:DnaK suppressor protein